MTVATLPFPGPASPAALGFKAALQAEKAAEATAAFDPELESALRARLMRLIKKPLTARSLSELEQVTKITRQLLVAGASPAALSAGCDYAPYLGQVPGPGGSLPVDSLYSAGPMMSGPAHSPPAETWAATLMRELIAGLGGLKGKEEEDPLKIIAAISFAKERGLEEVADKLSARLGVHSKVGPIGPGVATLVAPPKPALPTQGTKSKSTSKKKGA